jgi:hypothetical protein
MHSLALRAGIGRLAAPARDARAGLEMSGGGDEKPSADTGGSPGCRLDAGWRRRLRN